mmetsp:Transcript_102145/g.284566  ORF Transcript_102145/g.284566 Transcript_102145/m.284566 type:complete len:534 (+) Transcript_102145:345-1946(+)
MGPGRAGPGVQEPARCRSRPRRGSARRPAAAVAGRTSPAALDGGGPPPAHAGTAAARRLPAGPLRTPGRGAALATHRPIACKKKSDHRSGRPDAPKRSRERGNRSSVGAPVSALVHRHHAGHAVQRQCGAALGHGSGGGLLVTHQVAVEHGHDDQGQQGRGDDATDDGAAHRRLDLAAVVERDRHRQHAEDHRGRRHDDRAHPDQPGLAQRLGHRGARLAGMVGKVHQQDGVLRDEAHQHHEADHREHIERRAPQQQGQHHTDQRQRQAGHDGDGLQEAAELAGQHDVDEDHRQAHRREQAVEGLGLLLAGAIDLEADARRQLRALDELLHLGVHIAAGAALHGREHGLAALQVLAADHLGVEHRIDAGDLVQRDRRAVLGEGDRQLDHLFDASALFARQAQHHLDLVAIRRRPVGRHVAVDIGAQRRCDLRRGQAQFADGRVLQPHRKGRQAGLDGRVHVHRARDGLDLLDEILGGLGQHLRVGAEQGDPDRPVEADADLDARDLGDVGADRVLDLLLRALAVAAVRQGDVQ